MHRYASIFLLLLLCLSALPQPSVRSNPDELRRFHNDALNITYFYPSRFVPVPSPPSTAFSTDTPQCVRTTLFANSVTPIDTSSFALSTIDNTCLDVLRRATQLGSFIREDILRQLKQYGEPRITQEPTHYIIDGRPAATVEDVRALAEPVLQHRVLTNFHAEAEGIDSRAVIAHLLRDQRA